jgi:hypothetical protein
MPDRQFVVVVEAVFAFDRSISSIPKEIPIPTPRVNSRITRRAGLKILCVSLRGKSEKNFMKSKNVKTPNT